MDLKNSGITKQELLLLFSGLLALLALLLIYNRPPFYDEDAYLRNVILLQKYGLSYKYLENHEGSAGPLYPALHYIFSPLTQIKAPYIRLVNVALLLGSIYFISRTLNLLSFSKSFAFQMMAIPMTYVIGGLALTEMPAIFFLSAGIYLIIKTGSTKRSYVCSALQVSLAGLFISFAILGRQPFLLILAALPVLIFRRRELIRTGSLLLITIFFSIALPGYIFFIWKGFVAPLDAAVYNQIAVDGVSYMPMFFFLCVGYFAVIFLIIAPYFFIKPSKKEAVLLFAGFIVLFIFNPKYKLILFLPYQFLFEKIISASILKLAQVVIGVVMTVGSLYFLLSLVKQLHRKNYQKELVFFSAAILFIAISCVKITWGFSSRYPAQAVPFLIPICAYFYKRSRFNVYRTALGVILGLVSFASYIILGE